MAGTRDLTAPRLQFRLDLTDPEQQALYDELMALPKGRRNAVIVERLQRGEELGAMIYAIVRRAMKDEKLVMFGYDLAAPDNRDKTVNAAAKLPDELFDTKPFISKV
jgi:hypothetical protein